MQVNQALTSQSSSPVQRPPSEQLEQAFLEEMLKYCGPKSNTGEFGGGIGEDQFSSFLIQEQAAVLASQLDFGFAKELVQ